MDPIAGTPGQLPNKYTGTYLAKPLTKSTTRAPFWNSFISNRIGPTTVGDLPRFLDEFYRFHNGKLDHKFEILTDAFRQCNQITHSVYWFLEQGPVKNNAENMFLLNRALFRNHEICDEVSDALQRCIEKSPKVIDLFRLGRRSNAFDAQHTAAAKLFLKKLVKRTMRDPHSWNLFRRSFLVDEMREYILTTGMILSDIEDELHGQNESETESVLGPHREYALG